MTNYEQQLKLKERHLEQKVFQVRILFTMLMFNISNDYYYSFDKHHTSTLYTNTIKTHNCF
jgi:hypothetical protein